MKDSRNPNMDIIRCVALLAIVSVHFFLYNGFYDQIVLGWPMYLMTFIRSTCVICVPLFMILSGYLMKNKKLESDFYKKGVKTLGVYILASLACTIYKALYLKQPTSIFYTIKGILSYSEAPYGWYIEMYIGLFLLIPFLNILYNNIPTKKWKQVLILTLIALTAIGGVANVYDWTSLEWWVKPSMNGTLVQIVPAWWGRIYPLTYYFIGCYLKEYGSLFKKKTGVLIVLITAIVNGGYNIWRSYGTYFIDGAWQEYGSLINLLLAVSVFSLVLSMDGEKIPLRFRKILEKVSNLCLGAYLVSWIFEDFFYSKLKWMTSDIVERFRYYIIIVPIIYLCALALSWGLEGIYNGIRKLGMINGKKTG